MTDEHFYRTVGAVLWGIILLVMAIMLYMAARAPAHGHVVPTHWLNKHPYNDPVTGRLCCYHKSNMTSRNHCHELDYSPIRNNDGSYTLRTGEVVPKARVQWSKDYHYYDCRDPEGVLLCFFAVPDGS